jgi:hypothetical protein
MPPTHVLAASHLSQQISYASIPRQDIANLKATIYFLLGPHIDLLLRYGYTTASLASGIS